MDKKASGRDGGNRMRCLVAKSSLRASDKRMPRGVKLLWPLGFGFCRSWVSMALNSLELELGCGKGLLPNFLGERTLGFPLSRIPAQIASWISTTYNCWTMAKG